LSPEKTDEMELYEYARPGLMSGKKILFLHGFASSGQSGTAKTLRLLIPDATVLAPDIPTDPHDAISFLKSLVEKEDPDLIIGTSMGGMYAEMLHGHDRILVNPAFELADTILKNNGLGRKEFHNPREDGETSFLVTKGMLEDFRDVSSHCFELCGDTDEDYPAEGAYNEEQRHVWGLFGIHDTLVHTHDLFARHYPQCIRYDGEHSLNDKAILHSVLPVVQWIDDKQEGRSRKTLMFSLDDTLLHIDKAKPYAEMEPEPGAVKAFEHLSQSYDTYILASRPYNNPESWCDAVRWCESNLGVRAWNRVLVSNRKDLVMGDYVIDAHPDRYGLPASMWTVIHYGEDPYKTWDDVVTFFDRLGGQ